MLEQVMSLMGLIASIWLVLGVFYAAKLYPNYNHSEQFCSELGAAGSPTQRFSPIINNYPLGVLFCLFGVYVFNLEPNIWLQLTGLCIVVHGLGTWVAGFFRWTQILTPKHRVVTVTFIHGRGYLCCFHCC